jgi:hypothetical protein
MLAGGVEHVVDAVANARAASNRRGEDTTFYR